MPRPNVLLICADHFPGPLLGPNASNRVLLPTLNALAASGRLFTQAYTATPTCIPARRALMTGTTSRTHGDRTFREEMCRTIQRRDPTRPAFWYCSFITPHPPVTPPTEYLDMYHQLGVEEPFVADWAEDLDQLPLALKLHGGRRQPLSRWEIELARKGFLAQCTYIDHQIRLVVGMVREAGLLDDTIILFTSDHGDMLGNHNLWAKPPMYEWSARIPMLLMPTADDERIGSGRLVELRDIMPTLLELCDLPIPHTVKGQSLVGDRRRDHLYCEHYEGDRAMRMIRAEQYKLIWYPVGNRVQLFDLENDPRELRDLSNSADHAATLQRLSQTLVAELYGSDLEWVRDGELVGEPDKPFTPVPNRGLSSQRGWR